MSPASCICNLQVCNSAGQHAKLAPLQVLGHCSSVSEVVYVYTIGKNYGPIGNNYGPVWSSNPDACYWAMTA